MDAKAELTLHNVGNDEHRSHHIARAVHMFEEKGLRYQVGPSGTTVIGPVDQVFQALQECHTVLCEDHEPVISTVNVETRERFEPDALEGAVEKVGQQLSQAYPESTEHPGAQAFQTSDT